MAVFAVLWDDGSEGQQQYTHHVHRLNDFSLLLTLRQRQFVRVRVIREPLWGSKVLEP
jgi:hypothetical protein